MNSCQLQVKKKIIYTKLNRKIFPNISKIYVQLIFPTTLSSVHIKATLQTFNKYTYSFPMRT